MRVPVTLSTSLCVVLLVFAGVVTCSPVERNPRRRSQSKSLCAQLIQPSGYPCSEHSVQTKDGYVLALQRVSAHTGGDIKAIPGPPILLQHGLFQGGDTWFVNSKEQSLGFILADHGFDVWVGNVRGTHWSHGHISFSEKDKEFWDWSWQELALYDLAEMITYVYSITNSKIFYVGHSQGTIMALAAFTHPYIVEMVEAAALLCPISYLGRVSSQFVLRMVNLHLDQVLLAMGVHQLNFRSDIGVQLLDSVCDGHMDCSNLLSAITGKKEYDRIKGRRRLRRIVERFHLAIEEPKLEELKKGAVGQNKRLHPCLSELNIPKPLRIWDCLNDTSIGKNCCFNESRVDFYLEYEPHPSSSKNLNHLFQMIRKGTFAKYDYGWWGNLKQYGRHQPPAFDLRRIPKSLPLWMGYGGNDALADLKDVKQTLKELQSEPELLYLDHYGHIDFILSVTAREEVYNNLIGFFRSSGMFST